jgi:DNA phosphorothioation-dependent restriction protein DptG
LYYIADETVTKGSENPREDKIDIMSIFHQRPEKPKNIRRKSKDDKEHGQGCFGNSINHLLKERMIFGFVLEMRNPLEIPVNLQGVTKGGN